MPWVEIEQFAESRAASAASQPPLDFIDADLPAEPLRDPERDQTSEVTAGRFAAARVQG
jgi:hypothetical protein